jgi:hypothetical protein
MNSLKTIMRTTINKKLQADTIFGILLSIGFALVLWTPVYAGSIPNSFVIFTGILIIINLINIVNDFRGVTSKYALMDSILYFALMVYFLLMLNGYFNEISNYMYSIYSNSFTDWYDANSPTYDVYLSRSTIYTAETYMTNFAFWMTFVILGFALYGFFTRYDSRFKKSVNRVSLGSILSTNTQVATLVKDRGTMTIANRVHLNEESHVGESLNDYAENIPKKEEEQDLFDEILNKK